MLPETLALSHPQPGPYWSTIRNIIWSFKPRNKSKRGPAKPQRYQEIGSNKEMKIRHLEMGIISRRMQDGTQNMEQTGTLDMLER